MLLRSPNSLHYPITVTELLRQPNDNIERFQPLFAYTYKSLVTEGDEYGDERQVEKAFPARYESESEGVLLKWRIAKGTVIAGPEVEIMEIEEPCRHEQQFGGLCAICGKDMTEVNYNTSKPDADRAKINMLHSTTALLISDEEASRVDEDTKRRLLSHRKLTLVVDLDQTIIHATVDPTVAEWQNDSTNPNYPAVKDVQKFQLMDDGPGKGCWYYIKLRPGLKQFLEEVSKIYELHIYTMGTRAYAENIAKIVDPDRKIFGQRILSRDESGSLTTKSLIRLFPVDTKMVVIIDDRGDVWNWTENLVKVTPYDFFVGIGDINSSFLPRRTELLERPATVTDDLSTSSIRSAPEAEGGGDIEKDPGVLTSESWPDPAKSQPEEDSKAELSPSSDQEASKLPNGLAQAPTEMQIPAIEKIVNMGAAGNPVVLQRQESQQDEEISSQLTDRPLLQKQKILDEADEKAMESGKDHDGSTNGPGFEVPQQRHHLLQDDDGELEYLGKALSRIHRSFFEEYDRNIAGSQGGRIAELRGEKAPKRRPHEELLMVPDIKEIMPRMKYMVLDGLQICFTGVVPLGINIHYSDLGRWATSFGAEISDNVTRHTTHVIATKNRRTAKVRAAARTNAHIVTTAWLFTCFTQWKKVDEGPYLIHSDVHQDPGIDTTVFDALTEENDLRLSDEEDGDAESDAEDGLHLDITMAEVGPSKPADEESPIENLGDDDWKDMWAEFNDLPSDDGESAGESDDDSDKSDASQQEKDKTKKRKRDVSTAESTDAEDSDASNHGGAGSKLQQRKKRAMERTSSLQDVESASRANGHEEEADGDGGEDDDDDDDGFGAEFEADLEAELMQSDDDDVEDEVG